MTHCRPDSIDIAKRL